MNLFLHFALQISAGPKNWLKEQKKNSAKFLLAPIGASRNSLHSAYHLLSNPLDLIFYAAIIFFVSIGFNNDFIV